MAITYNPYGWEIRRDESENERLKRERDEAIKSLYKCDNARLITQLLCTALIKHEQYIKTSNISPEAKFDHLFLFDNCVNKVYNLRNED